ncbi:MAG: IS110 family transposase, partial [Chloroflexota bacterium]
APGPPLAGNASLTQEYTNMSPQSPVPKRFLGLDVHKYYLIAIGVDADLNQVLGPQRVELARLDAWIEKNLRPDDALALEMTTNTWQLYDELAPRVQSVTVVHPPHVALITRAQVMTDKIAALTLAKLLAKGLLVSVWVPPQEVRDQRALVAQRAKMTRLATQAKNRLHALLQRHHLAAPEGNPFHPSQNDWWLALPVNKLEQANCQSDLDTLRFAEGQQTRLTATMNNLAAQDERVPRLVQMSGFATVTPLTVLAAIGTITRFPTPKKLVGYSGLGARIHDSGLTTRTGKITKAGRKDLRAAMVEAAQTAANTHPHWKAELKRLEPRLGRNKAIVAIARKLLVAVWYVLNGQPDRFAEPELAARKFFQHAYRLGQDNRPAGQSVGQYVREQLDQLGLGADLTHIPWGSKKKPLPLPPSRLTLKE